MPSDRHTELLNMAARWIRNRSFKICGIPEFNGVGYVADYFAIAGMWDSHHTRYAEHAGLKKAYMVSRIIDGEWKRIHGGDIDRWYACVFEVKVSRADFLNTFGNKGTPHAKARQEPVGTAHWLVAEKDICKPEELPDFWGLLTPYGSGLTEKKMPKLNILPDSTLHAFAFDLLWLQMNFRRSSYNHRIEMADSIKVLHRAILDGRPHSELLRRSKEAMKSCKGMS